MSGPWIAAWLALSTLVVITTFLVLGLLRRVSPLLEQAESALRSAGSGPGPLQGLPIGTELPQFEARDVRGSVITDADLAGTPAVVLFIDPGCGPCERLMAELRSGWAGEQGARLWVVTGNGHERELDLSGKATVLLQSDERVSRAFQTSITPHAFAIGIDGTIVNRDIPDSTDALVKLARQAREGR
jgi:hypothetical protein